MGLTNQNLLLGPLGNILGNIPGFVLTITVIWSVLWKGFSLWKSARNNQRYWFIALLILNTLGIAPIIYLAFFQMKRKASKNN